MFWADKILQNQKGPQLINDSFTPSGVVHMGSLKGPVIHDTFYKILKDQGKEVLFSYGFDDMDPIDGLAPNLQEKFNKYLGVPLFLAPSPDGKGSFADYFSAKMIELLDTLEIKPDLYRTHEIYQRGEFDAAIKVVLDHADKVRKVYGDIYHKTIPDTWYPLQIICPQCGKLGTTRVAGWDGTDVTFNCEKNLVTWAQGCGASGKISPFGGRGKMPWKVEWAAKWATFGITIEAAGKDHASAGGSYDVAMKICKEVFGKTPPLKLGYEFFLSGGKKMSSSKGLGMTGEELLEVLGPRVAHFLMIKVDPVRAVEFTPRGTDIVPKLYDEYQKSANAYFEKKDEDISRAFELSQIDEPKMPLQVRFSVLAQLIQMPNMQEKIQKAGYGDWAKYARVWVDKYAPDSEKFVVAKELPKEAKKLSKEQKNYLQKIAMELEKKLNPEDFQKELYVWSKELAIPSKDAFAAIYLALIGKDHGPKAGWLILSLDKEFIKKRFLEIDKN
ncbi:lysine--tRNA ligase [Patescibacteria group bacterium]|nr:lysine--tRNA ligase [Patescibacteria group bacterium]